jgi:phosphatidylinositol-3-phosphatase
MTALRRVSVLVLAATLGAAGCGQEKPKAETGPPPSTVAPASALPQASAPPPPSARPPASVAAAGPISKVLLIAEENHAYDQIIGAPDAPYLNELARTYGSATRMDAGYRAACPSLAAYILLTSGSTAGICDDRTPKAHRLRGDNVFQQVAASGRDWRGYAESAPGPCPLVSSSDGRYLVRHVPATYYIDGRQDCARWVVPMGDPHHGALHDDVAGGTLPAFGFVTPDACHDMHGAATCPADGVGTGDRWLRSWLPSILAGPDYRAGRLAIIITWDEGTSTDNHIPTLVISPTTRHTESDQAFTHCSTLRTIEELLRLPLLGCAAGAASMVAAFHL